MSRIRHQFSLFVPDAQADTLQKVRRLVDPMQYQLIPAHVTLCREDELADLPVLIQRLRHLSWQSFPLTFSPPERFSEHGILMSCCDGLTAFQHLRETVLATTSIRVHQPHLTLAHPRNPKASANTLSNTAALKQGCTIRFDQIQLIEQVDDHPWRVLEQFNATK